MNSQTNPHIERNPPSNPPETPILWKKVFCVQDMPEFASQLLKSAWGIAICGVLLLLITNAFFIPYIGSDDFTWTWYFVGGYLVCTLFLIAAVVLFIETYLVRQELKGLRQWYSPEALKAYEESASISSRFLTLKLATNTLIRERLEAKHQFICDKDFVSFNVAEIQEIHLIRIFKKYFLTFYGRHPTASQEEKPRNLIFYYRKSYPRIEFDIGQPLFPRSISKSEADETLRVLKTLVPLAKVKFIF